MLRPTRSDFRAVVDLAAPLAAVQVGMMLMGVVDTVMVGRVSAAALAATAVANVWFFAVTTIGMGCIAVLDPVISQAHGARDSRGVARGVQRGFVLAAGLTIPTSLALLPAEAVLVLTGQPAEVVPLAGEYLGMVLPGVFPYFAFMVVREALQALGVLRPLLLVILLANLLNGFTNWVFIFGHAGAPVMGVAGAGVATTVSRWAMLAGLLLITWSHIGPRVRPWHRESLAWAPMVRMLAVGLPIGFQILFEYGVFGGVGLLMGRFGTAAVAGHQIALNMAALSFMVPFGIGTAASVLVGRAIGADRADEARRRATAALILAASFMCATALLFLAIPGPLARLYSPDVAVAGVAASLLPLAGAFQIFDGTQAVALGALRGKADTRIPVLINLAGYYAVGLPVGLWLAFVRGHGPRGLWWGLVAGLAVVALVLLARVHHQFGRPLARLIVDRDTRVPGVG